MEQSDNFVIEQNTSALCLIWEKVISISKEYNIRGIMKQSIPRVSTLNLKASTIKKVLFFKKSLTAQRQIFAKQKHENEAAVRASFEISHALAKSDKLFTDG